MLSFFAAQVEKEKVWDLERVWFWLVTEECVEEEEGIGGVQLTIASQSLVTIVALLVR